MKFVRTSLWLVIAAFTLSFTTSARAEDGYDLWLRYAPATTEVQTQYRSAIGSINVEPASATLQAARDELTRGLSGILGAQVRASNDDGASLIAGTPASSKLIAELKLPLEALGDEGYVIRTIQRAGRPTVVIASKGDVGVLYGAFHFLRLLQSEQPIDALKISERPSLQVRVLNHWDNLDRTVERGYAGQSIWDWHKLPDHIDPRYVDYARANASIGINGTVLTNVNANATALTPMYLEKFAAIANTLRPYGVRVYLTARFSAPIEIGGLKSADPLDPAVREWWQRKTEEIYKLIPDFGGYLVKANSEGQPGPQDYGRSHADGANMLADAVAPHDGIVMWRAFVYSNEEPDDRAKQAYNEFVPFDGKFRENVLVQVKNGAIDFQPREPFHPLFGAMPRTPLMMEFQITKEYLGFATHLAYLAPMFEEALKADTFVQGKGSTVAKVLDGSLHNYARTGMAGVANIGVDRNWSGSHFDQANWYAYGRLAWNPHLDSRAIANEWVRMTFSNDARFVDAVVEMMMQSREAVVDYMTPLGLHHLMGEGHHYGPAPWVEGGPRADWTSVYYHRATTEGIGFDRTPSGSNATAQYAKPVAKLFNDRKAIPEQFLLWFHHVPWDYKMDSGRTLWNELVHAYSRGVQSVSQMRTTWDAMKPYVDAQRHAHVASFLRIQENEAKWWRDACLAYFQTFSKRPFPEGYAAPEHSLEYYKSLKFPYAPGHH